MENEKSKLVYLLFCAVIIFIFNLVPVNSKEYLSDSISKINTAQAEDLSKIFESTSSAQQFAQERNTSKVEIINGEIWIKVSVRLKDNSGLGVIMRTDTNKDELLKQKSDWFEKSINETLKLFNDKNFKLLYTAPEGFTAKVTKEGLDKLVSSPNVDLIGFSTDTYKLSLAESAPLIGANYAWNLSYTGTGIKVCIIDSGVNSSYQDLQGRVANQHCYCSLDGGCCPNGEEEDTSAIDDQWHGTYVAQILASSYPTRRGIANGTSIYAVKVFNKDGEVDPDNIGQAIDWCVSQGVDIISMSFGRDNYWFGCPSDYNTQINNAFTSDIFLTAASGNDNKLNKISYPACNPHVISVGETYDFSQGTPGSFYDNGNLICTDDTVSVNKITCETNRNSNLNLLAPGCSVSTRNFTACGTSASTPMVAGSVALLLQKDPTLTSDEILYKLQSTGINVHDSATGLNFKRIDVQEALDTICKCSAPVAGSCGSAGGCDEGERRYTKTCDPYNCQTESTCETDSTCESGGGGAPQGVMSCTPDSCASGYTDQGVTNYANGNYWTSKRTCYKQELSDWIHYSSDSDSRAGWKSDGTVYCGSMALSTPGNYEQLKVENNIGYSSSSGELNRVKWHVNVEDTSESVSSCSNFVSSFSPTEYPDNCGSSCSVNDYVELFKGTSNCNTICDNNWLTGCDDINYWIDCSADLYYKKYNNLYDNKTCDVPYTNNVNLENPIYGNNDAECDAEVQGSASNPDEMKVRWYVNGNNLYNENCYGYGSNTCDDYSGNTWSNIFFLSHSYYSRGDTVYCKARGDSEDDGHGAYVKSDEVTVSNLAPTFSGISLSKSVAKQGDYIQATANSEADADSDMLSMYCCNGDSCTPSISNHDFCYAVGDSYPYDLSCLGQGDSGDGTKTIRCAIYDGESYSSIYSDTYTADNTAPSVEIIKPFEFDYPMSEVEFKVAVGDANGLSTCQYSLNGSDVNYSMSSYWSYGFYSLWNATNSSMLNGNYTVRYWCNDSVGNVNDTETRNFSINAPMDTYKFYHKNSAGENVAWFGNNGNIVLKGNCFSGGNCNNPGDNSIIFENSTGNYVAFINSTGDLCVHGNCFGQNSTCNTNPQNAFIIRNSTNDNVIYIDKFGDLCLIGKLYENSIQ